MSKTTLQFSTSIVLALLMILSQTGAAETRAADTPVRMEIFDMSDRPSDWLAAWSAQYPQLEVQIYTLDAIEKFEDELSDGLPADPSSAKELALNRLQHMSKETRANLEQSATALAKALQYGIERLPAIVFDAQYVVYGLRDPWLALPHYRQWQLGGRQ
jgi:integrating conjugative element protein (TIGR03757 family)